MLRNLKSFNPSEIEEKVLQFWREKNVFQKTLLPKKGKSKRIFKFWEGPPTANARPGIHHALARSFKDVILRYKTMQGFIVPRKGGWDTHGLPVELQVEKQLGLSSKKDIEKYGVAEFNKKCKESVWVYKSEWEKLTERMGFWVDLNNPYITYHNNYIETLWWIIKKIYKKGLMYLGYKIVLWCPRCGTGLSSHEVAQGYKEITENSVYLKFKLNKGQKIAGFTTDDSTYVLSWTTTPWTLPGNVALAVGKDVRYVRLRNKDSNETYIIAKDLVNTVFKEFNGAEMGFFSGKDLINISYQPLFKIKSLSESKNSYKIYSADFVTTTDGTGVVHTAVMYGEDDYELGKKIGLPQRHTVDENGRFTKEVVGFEGMYVKAKETEDKLFEHLKNSNNFLSVLPYTHEYPFCWRCDTPLLYYGRNSWFVSMSKLRNQLIKNNKGINWVPEHIKEGRFGEWLREIKDWNFSRERYWGTPLPIWRCGHCHQTQVIGSSQELSSLQEKSSNCYLLLRHGQAESNIKKIVNCDPKEKDKDHLTLKGRVHVEKLARKLKKEKINLIFSSDFHRTKETAEIIAKETGIKKIVFDKRLREMNFGKFHGHNTADYHILIPSYEDKFSKSPLGGENLEKVAQRVWDFIRAVEKKYKNKTVLLVSHEYPIWIISSVLNGWSQEQAIEEKIKRGDDFVTTGQVEKLSFVSMPRNGEGLGDFHRPYIDEIVLRCQKCGGDSKRVKEIADVWFDSGAMPFAQDHFPFNNKRKLKVEGGKLDGRTISKEITFPADYISEAIDQTRGWFYTLLAVATALGLKTPYKNVICLGHVRDKNGQKMSKSKGNIVDPWIMINKHGIDAIRWYFYSINSPGEPKNFDEEDVKNSLRKVLMIVYNSFVFLQTYAKDNLNLDKLLSSSNLLDKWILLRLSDVASQVEKRMNDYDILKSTQLIEELIDDLSRWYIRRSRRRLQKPNLSAKGKKDYEAVSAALAYALLTISKLLASFTPFFAEALYQSLKKNYKFNSQDSVHLESWPSSGQRSKIKDKGLLDGMSKIRNLASLILAKRAELGIKVKQPLQQLKVKDEKLKVGEGLLEILRDEVNIKEVIFDKNIESDFELDTNITPELRMEGKLRELTRTIQDLRQEAGCVPKDKILVWIDGNQEAKALIESNSDWIKREVGAKKVETGRTAKFSAEIETKIDTQKIWIGIKKV
ncbi:MAG: Isoleucine-tRNA ligase [Candidatus Wolfebacteria bacterium GW2011_GWC1_43_10]|uniref:Isoleucine--tRNA ligase n=1 Tax=Candidatus Wolfebacteria bacterium GW2011_GWC1_43_10 TaxID=1619011 RepID=A0A0G1EGL4_9BACT|nr:MAG: Isoleucine-tRNA ligase [Candidatus Wolfebacteria bacterium GW2011_GWC1_43_10]KKT22421.1 MAG: Isoleucine-tRNA ligase [Parcubacteria group bacterium GW2011_GWB1_43_8b]